MSEHETTKQGEDFQQRLAEVRKTAFEEEIVRLNRETEQRAPDLVKSLKAKDEVLYREQLREAEEARQKEEKSIVQLERSVAERLEAERARKKARRAEEARLRSDADEQRKHQEDEGRRRAEEERRKQEELLRQQREEFVRREQELRKQAEERRIVEEQLRLKQEEERKRREEERKIREEQERIERENAERLRREEEIRLQTEEMKRQEEERRRLEEEEKRLLEEKRKSELAEQQLSEEQKRQVRIQQLLANAQRFFDGGEYDLALVEVAKTLVNDPENAEALELDARIKELQGKQPVQAPETKTKRKQAPRKRVGSRSRPISADDQERKPLLTRPVLKWAGAAVLVLAVVLGYMFRGTMFRDHVRIAVIPFASASNNPEERSLGAAVAEEVSHRLEQADNATVLGFASSIGLMRSEGWPSTTLYRSGFSFAVEGSFTQSDLGYSVDVRLKDSSGQVLWSQRILKNPQSLVEIAGTIAEEVSDKLDIDIPKRPAAETFNLEAYTAYLAGLSLSHHDDPDSLRAACAKFQEALAHDQNLATALAVYSATLSHLVELGSGDSSSLATGRELADRAIQANSSFAPSYVASAYNHCMMRRYSQALDQLDRAERIAPNLSTIPLMRAKILLRTGNYAEALRELGLAYEASPRDAEVLELLGYAQTFNRIKGQAVGYHQLASRIVENPVRYVTGPLADAMILDLDLGGTDRVISSLEERLQADPADAEASYRMGRMLQVSGKAREGSDVLEQLDKQLRAEIKADPTNAMSMAFLAKTLTRLGRFPEATAFARRAVEAAPADPVVRYRIAQMYALQMYSPQKHKIDDKKKEEAIQTLRAAVKLQYRAQELANADFYNMYDQANFLGIIKDSAQ